MAQLTGHRRGGGTVDAAVSKTAGGNPVWVRLPLPARSLRSNCVASRWRLIAATMRTGGLRPPRRFRAATQCRRRRSGREQGVGHRARCPCRRCDSSGPVRVAQSEAHPAGGQRRWADRRRGPVGWRPLDNGAMRRGLVCRYHWRAGTTVDRNRRLSGYSPGSSAAEGLGIAGSDRSSGWGRDGRAAAIGRTCWSGVSRSEVTSTSIRLGSAAVRRHGPTAARLSRLDTSIQT